jgi:membrane-bound serine protease (ClpP class)
MIPVVLVFAYKTMPKTRFGKTVLLAPPEASQGKGIPDREKLNATLGQTGVVLSDLRPVGTVDFLGKRIECVAETGYIPKDVKVRVINVDGSQVTVRQVEET